MTGGGFGRCTSGATRGALLAADDVSPRGLGRGGLPWGGGHGFGGGRGWGPGRGVRYRSRRWARAAGSDDQGEKGIPSSLEGRIDELLTVGTEESSLQCTTPTGCTS